MNTTNFHKDLKAKMDHYVHLVYEYTRTFPKEELYGVTSQLRRSSLSVVLNYIEGFARQRSKVNKHFLEVSYGSLKESRYLLEFSALENFISDDQYAIVSKLADDIGAMLWGILKNIDKKVTSFKL